jgi:hypothetical protein
MFTPQNYFGKIKDIDFSQMPEAIQEGHNFIVNATDNGMDWKEYVESTGIKEMMDTYFSKLQQYLDKKNEETSSAPDKTHSRKPRAAKKEKQEKPLKTSKRGATKTDTPAPARQHENITLVERVPEEIRFIKRFVNLHGKTKDKDDLLRFINSLQKAILEKRIRKTSPYAEQIRYIQDALINVYNSMKGKLTMQIKPETYEEMKAIAAGEKVMPAINFIKRYIGMNGKTGMKEKARQLLTQIARALDKGTLKDDEPYMTELYQVQRNLQDFISSKQVRTLEIEKATLNGLQGILNGCNCGGGFHGFDSAPAALPQVMNSMDFANVEFKTLGFSGEWYDLMGDPALGFTVMVSAKPKRGKSILSTRFAGYLARKHGNVLYVAKEEGLDKTLQQKLDDENVKHPNLYVAAELPADLSAFDFIFLDSVTRLGLTPEDLRRLKAFNPAKSFVFIFQSTKQGNFRGANAFQHDVDVVIEIPEKGKAVAMGRFNQGGEMVIFPDAQEAP